MNFGIFAGISRQHMFLHGSIFLFLLFMTGPVDGGQNSTPKIGRPSAQALELARRARREGRNGRDARAQQLWNLARAIDPGVPPPPVDWSVTRKSQRFIASVRDRQLTRDEELVLITMLPYQKAQQLLAAYLNRFPDDRELRELSLVMANFHHDSRLQRLQNSALNGQTLDNCTWLYGLRLIMLSGYVFLIRMILSHRKPRKDKLQENPHESF